MKHFTKKSLLAVCALTLSLSASAQIQWKQDNTTFLGTHRTAPILADFNNDGLMDIYYGGQYDHTHTGWEWQIQTNLYLNNGDGTWEYDGYQRMPRTEMQEVLDDAGNPVLDGEGNPTYQEVTVYDRIWPKSGLPGNTYSVYQVLDYNNDGLVDIIINGKNEWDIFDNAHPAYYTYLYKNIGDGKFEVVADAAFPMMYHEDKNFNPIAVGDYNRDGYTDLLFSVCLNEKEADNYPGRAVYLYRNENGTGTFSLQNIADTKGGVWTSEITDDQGIVITEKEKLEGLFAPISGNAIFADINNDGWLDILVNGWSDVEISGHAAGNNGSVYLNQNGEKFIDITSEIASFYTLRNSSSCVGDLNLDGFLDWIITGWGDGGVNWNTYTFLGTGSGEDGATFEDPFDCNTLGLPGCENVKTYMRDFNVDGFMDIYYSGNSNDNDEVWFGDETGMFTRQEPVGMIHIQSAGIGDVNNDGYTDVMVTGYGWDLTMWNETNQSYGQWDGYAGLNTNGGGDVVEAPAAPTNVSANYTDGKLNISWEYDIDAAIVTGLVYNIYVKKADGSVYTMLPANIENGYIKVGCNRETAIRPTLTSYSLTMPAGEYTVGVQAVSTMTETQSAFTSVVAETTGIVDVESAAEVIATEYYNMQGQKLSKAPETGAYIVKAIKADGNVNATINIK